MSASGKRWELAPNVNCYARNRSRILSADLSRNQKKKSAGDPTTTIFRFPSAVISRRRRRQRQPTAVAWASSSSAMEAAARSASMGAGASTVPT